MPRTKKGDKMPYLTVKECFLLSEPVNDVTVKGWVRTRRDSKGGFSFIEVNDGSTIKNIQIVADQDISDYESIVLKLNTGDSISVTGDLVNSQGTKQKFELKAKEIVRHGTADPEEFPLQKKRHSFEFLREIAHLRPRTNTFGGVFRLRHLVSYAIHQYFHEKGFFYIHTPIITGSDCEGAGEMFHVTTMDLKEIPKTKDGMIDFQEDFFKKEANLTVSGQLEVESFACSLGKVYTFGPTFRAENSNTSRHLAEFWMVEPEMAFYEIKENMDLAEDFLKTVLKKVLREGKDDLEFFNSFVEKGLIDKINQVIENQFERLSYTEAVEILKNSKKSFDYPVEWGIDLQSEHERYLTEEYIKKPVILTDYPKTIKPFYMKVNDDDKTVRAMDVLVPGIGEIIGGSQREERLDVLKNRIQELNLREEDYWWYLDLRKFGTVPHSGFGLGLERLLLFVTGMKNIRDVIPFHRTPGHIEF